MASTLNGANPSVLLSTEELLAVLDMLQANFIPGLDGDIAQALSSQERQLMLTTARHSLLARELLRENENGAALHRRIMAAVGACVYSQGAILAFHWPPKSGQPSRFFGHFQGNEVVAHTRPKEILHRFVIFDERAALVDALLEAFEHEPTPPAPPWKLAVARDLLDGPFRCRSGPARSGNESLVSPWSERPSGPRLGADLRRLTTGHNSATPQAGERKERALANDDAGAGQALPLDDAAG